MLATNGPQAPSGSNVVSKTGAVKYTGPYSPAYYATTPAKTTTPTQTTKTGYVGPYSASYYESPTTTSSIQTKQTPSTTITNANKIEQVPALNNRLTELQDKGVRTDTATGVATYADGRVARGPVLEEEVVADVSSEDEAINRYLDQMQSYLDASTATSISNIQQKFEQRRIEQRDINERQQKGITNALLMGGVTGGGSSAQYAPISSEGIITAQENYGLKQIADLDAQEQDLITAAKAAQTSGRFDILSKKIEQIEKIREEKMAEAQKLNEAISEQNKKIRERSIQASRDSAIADLYSQGITDVPSLLQQLGDSFTADEIAGTLETLSSNFGISTDKMSQDVQEYYALKNMEGGLPVSVLSLPSTADQIAAYIRMKTDAETKRTTKATGGTSGVSIGVTEKLPAGVDTTDPFIKKLLSTAGGKALTDTTIQKLDKGLTVLGQLGLLQASVQDVKTGPIKGKFKGNNPWNTNAQTIKAQLNAIIPNLARGVYGEVGVLTDNDIKTYAKTLPNLTSTEQVRNAVLYITLDMIGKSIKNTLNVNASAGRDVSNFIDIYTEMENTKNSILSTIPGAKVIQKIETNLGGSNKDDFKNNPIPTGSVQYSESVWERAN